MNASGFPIYSRGNNHLMETNMFKGSISAKDLAEDYGVFLQELIDIVESGKVTIYDRVGHKLDSAKEKKKRKDAYEDRLDNYLSFIVLSDCSGKITDLCQAREHICSTEDTSLECQYILDHYYFKIDEFKGVHEEMFTNKDSTVQSAIVESNMQNCTIEEVLTETEQSLDYDGLNDIPPKSIELSNRIAPKSEGTGPKQLQNTLSENQDAYELVKKLKDRGVSLLEILKLLDGPNTVAACLLFDKSQSPAGALKALSREKKKLPTSL